MKIIEQEDFNLIKVADGRYGGKKIIQYNMDEKEVIAINKKGAAELIKVLQEWVDEKH